MENTVEKVRSLAEKAAADMGIYVLGCDVSGIGSRKPSVTISADTESGITIDECVKLSREIQDLLDAYDIFADNYKLEVTSPGMSVPMQYDWQFSRSIGKRVRVIILTDDKKNRPIEGELKAVADADITVEVTGKGEVVLAREEIKEIKVIPQW